MSEQPTSPDAPVDDPGDGLTTPAAAQEEGTSAAEQGSFTGTPTFGVDDPERLAQEAQTGGSPSAADDRD